MGVIKTEATFIVTDYNFESVEKFENVLSQSSIYEKINGNNFKKVVMNQFKINGILLNADAPKPVIIYKNDDSDEIRYNHINRRLELVIRNYDDNKESFWGELLKDLSAFKLQEISNIGLNFFVEYDTGDKKLNIFNSEIHTKIKDFPKNVNFQVTLPFDLSEDFKHNCIGIYDITKIKVEDGKEHTYGIASNFNFALIEDKSDPIKRLNELQLITGQINDIFAKFKETYSQIVEL